MKQYSEKDLFDLNLAAHELVGKTILTCQVRPISEQYDDIPYLEIVFADGTSVTISSCYSGYSGSSEDEYTRYIGISKGGLQCPKLLTN